MASDIEMTEFRPLDQNNLSVFSRLPHSDLITFLAIVQAMNNCHILDFTPSFEKNTLIRGANTLLHATKFSEKKGIIFKRIDPMAILTEKEAFKILISELVVHEHAVVRTHPNIQRIYAIAWDVHPATSRILPVFGFEESQLGDLQDFFRSHKGTLSFMQRLQLCLDIGSALETLHSLNIVHGDIKPKNILVFQRDNGDYLAKVTDFGCSCFGLHEEDIVTLSRTRGWEAPEYRRGRFTVVEAKKYDIYIYGKLCFWVLFGPEMNIEDFIDGSLEAQVHCRFDEAVSNLQRSEGFQGEFIGEHRAFAKLGEVFQMSLVVDPRHREKSIRQVLDNLKSAAKEFRSCLACQGQKHISWIRQVLRFCLSIIEHDHLGWLYFSTEYVPKFDILSKVSVDFKLYRLDYYVRGLWMNQKKETLSPMQRQIVFLLVHSLIFAPIFFVVLFWWSLLVFSLFYLPDKASRIIISIVYSFIITRMMSYGGAQFMYHCIVEYLDSSRTFSSLWSSQHLVPLLPDLMPVFNRLHYRLRTQIVYNLIERSHISDGCDQCRLEASAQLALCYDIAFGTPMDKSKSSIEKSLSRLLKKAQQYDKEYTFRPRRDLETQFQTHFERTLSDVYTFEHITDAISSRIYESEIEGKKEYTGLQGQSVAALVKTLADILVRAGKYREGEEYYRKAITLISKEYCRGTSLSFPRYNPVHSQSVIALSLLLERQGKKVEASQQLCMALEHARECQFERSDVYLLTFKRNIIGRPHRLLTEMRIILLRLLITIGYLDDAVELDPTSLLEQTVNNGYDFFSEHISDLVENFEALIAALLHQKRIDTGVKLHRAWMCSLVQLLGSNQRYIDSKRLGFALTLSQGDMKQVHEALDIVAQLRSNCEQHEPDVLEIKTIQAILLARDRSMIGDAKLTLKETLERKGLLENDATELTLGCMSHLSMTLYHQLEEDRPLAILKELLRISERTPLYQDQFSVICLIVNFSTEGALKNSLALIENMLKMQAFSFPEQLSIQGHMAFMLSTEGLESENWKQLRTALQIATYVWEETRQTFSEDPLQQFNAESTLAAVYSKHALLYRSQGFDDLAAEHEKLSIMRYKSALKIGETTFGELDERTMLAAEKLAAASVESDFEEAVHIYNRIIGLKNHQEQSSKKEILSLRRTQARMQEAWAKSPTSHVQKNIETNYKNHGIALKWAKEDYNVDHPETIHRALMQAQSSIRFGRYEEAEKVLNGVHAYWIRVYGARHPGIIGVKKAIAINHRQMGRPHLQVVSELTELYYLALDVLGGGSTRHPKVLECGGCLATVLMADQGTSAEGVAMKNDVLELQSKWLGSEHKWTIESMRELSLFT